MRATQRAPLRRGFLRQLGKVHRPDRANKLSPLLAPGSTPGHDAAMTYANVLQLTERYGETTLRLITDPNGQAVNTVAAQQALDDASEEVDFGIGKRYELPLTLMTPEGAAVPAVGSQVLVRLCCDIAVYRLQVLRPADDIKDARQRYEDALKLLKAIGTGDAMLPYRLQRKDAPSAQGNAGVPVFGQPPSLFGRGNR